MNLTNSILGVALIVMISVVAIMILFKNHISDGSIHINRIIFVCSENETVCIVESHSWDRTVLFEKSELVFSYPLSNSVGDILSACREEEETRQMLCTARSTGATVRNVDPHFRADYGEYSLNDLGQVAYQCNTGSGFSLDEFRICGFEIADPEPDFLSSDQYASINPKINNNGTLIYLCMNIADLGESSPFTIVSDNTGRLCRMNFDGSDFSILTDNDLWIFDYQINDEGQILFNCVSTDDHEKAIDSTYDFCTFDGESRLLRFENQIGITGDISLNNAGEIVFPCRMPSGGDTSSICYKSHFAADPEDVLKGQVAGGTSAEIDDSGQIVFVCYDENLRGPFANEICVINKDGTGLHRITYDEIDNGQPSFAE